ncbi:SLAIN motif-containing protein 2-like [Littorina saxatilis]|uniref:SLAIN motif-containing protein 2 n=1 Tax=Littorina saxatilis TaxID=31220 RepID=A0AAN9B0Z0_9CAEN
MESADNSIDPDNEVKKLQELVKKLEKQNEVLRTKQKLSLDSLPNGDVEKSPLTHNNNHQAESPSDSMKDRSAEGGLEDVDVLDVDNLSLKEDEDSWLYSSPKPPTPQQSTISLYQWVRQDFDHPSPEVESARRSLLSKLDEVARMNRSSSTPALGANTSPTTPVTSLSRSTEESQKPYSRPHQKQSLLSMAGNRIDNGTFTRPKKSHERLGPMVAERDRGHEEVYNQHDVTNVEAVAKQQEESLRQSRATYTSPKRVLHNKSMSMASDTDNSGSPVGSNRSSPARFDHEGSYIGRHRNSFGSDNGTPPDSPRTVQQTSTPYSDANHPRKSLPNMSRLQYPPPSSHSSDSSLEHQSAGSMDDLNLAPETRTTSRLPAPGYRAASPSMGGLRPGLAGARGVSPQRSGLPTPRRSIPRPATAGSPRSSLPQPRRSGIPSPRPSGQGREESWREGCF